jgi:hypothetical protein
VDGENVFPLGIPLTATVSTIDMAAGWRFPPRAPRQGATPYIGGGLALTSLRESDEFSTEEELTSAWKTGFMFFGGVDWPLGRRGFFGVEGQWRTVPDGLGTSGVSATFEETDLGGLVVRALIGFRR